MNAVYASIAQGGEGSQPDEQTCSNQDAPSPILTCGHILLAARQDAKSRNRHPVLTLAKPNRHPPHPSSSLTPVDCASLRRRRMHKPIGDVPKKRASTRHVVSPSWSEGLSQKWRLCKLPRPFLAPLPLSQAAPPPLSQAAKSCPASLGSLSAECDIYIPRHVG